MENCPLRWIMGESRHLSSHSPLTIVLIGRGEREGCGEQVSKHVPIDRLRRLLTNIFQEV